LGKEDAIFYERERRKKTQFHEAFTLAKPDIEDDGQRERERSSTSKEAF